LFDWISLIFMGFVLSLRGSSPYVSMEFCFVKQNGHNYLFMSDKTSTYQTKGNADKSLQQRIVMAVLFLNDIIYLGACARLQTWRTWVRDPMRWNFKCT
jgi:hypothetical protein